MPPNLLKFEGGRCWHFSRPPIICLQSQIETFFIILSTKNLKKITHSIYQDLKIFFQVNLSTKT